MCEKWLGISCSPLRFSFIPSPLSSLSLSPSPSPKAAVHTYNSHTEIKYMYNITYMATCKRGRERVREREGKREKYACYAKWSLPWGYAIIIHISHTLHPIWYLTQKLWQQNKSKQNKAPCKPSSGVVWHNAWYCTRRKTLWSSRPQVCSEGHPQRETLTDQPIVKCVQVCWGFFWSLFIEQSTNWDNIVDSL